MHICLTWRTPFSSPLAVALARSQYRHIPFQNTHCTLMAVPEHPPLVRISDASDTLGTGCVEVQYCLARPQRCLTLGTWINAGNWGQVCSATEGSAPWAVTSQICEESTKMTGIELSTSLLGREKERVIFFSHDAMEDGSHMASWTLPLIRLFYYFLFTPGREGVCRQMTAKGPFLLNLYKFIYLHRYIYI